MGHCIGQNRVYVYLTVFLNTILATQAQLQAFCEQPAERGPCNNLELRYRFSEETEYCATFLYGGCEGNENNFKNIEECVKACVDEPVPDCELPKDSGSCFQADKIRYYFNEGSERCEKFYFSGCQGNKNNFETEEECRDTCGGLPPENTKATKTEKKTQNLWVDPVRPVSLHSTSGTKNGFTLVDNDPAGEKTKASNGGRTGSEGGWNVGAKSTSGNENLSGGFNRSWQSSNAVSTTAQSSTWGQNLRQQWNSSGGTKNNQTPTSATNTTETGWKPNPQVNTQSSNPNSWNNQNNWNNRNRWNNVASSNKQNWKGGNGWNKNWNNKNSWNNKWNPQGNAKVKNRWNVSGSNSPGSPNNKKQWGGNNMANGVSKQNNNGNNNWNQNAKVITNNPQTTWHGNRQGGWKTKKWHSNGNSWNQNTNNQKAGITQNSNNLGKGNQPINSNAQNNKNSPPSNKKITSWHSNKASNTGSWKTAKNGKNSNQNWNNGNVGSNKGKSWGTQRGTTLNGGSGINKNNQNGNWQQNKPPGQLKSWGRKRPNHKPQNKQNTLSKTNQNPATQNKINSGNPPVSFIGNVGMKSTAIHQNARQTQTSSFSLKSAPVIKEMVHGISKMSQYPSSNTNAFSRRNNAGMVQNQHSNQNNWNSHTNNRNSFSAGPPKRWHSMRSPGSSWNVNTNQNDNQNQGSSWNVNTNQNNNQKKNFGQSYQNQFANNGNNQPQGQVNNNNAQNSWNTNNHGTPRGPGHNNMGHVNKMNSYQVAPTQASSWQGHQHSNTNPNQQQGNGNSQWSNHRASSQGFSQHNSNNQRHGNHQEGNFKRWSSINNINQNTNATVFSSNQRHPPSPKSFSMKKHAQGNQHWQGRNIQQQHHTKQQGMKFGHNQGYQNKQNFPQGSHPTAVSNNGQQNVAPTPAGRRGNTWNSQTSSFDTNTNTQRLMNKASGGTQNNPNHHSSGKLNRRNNADAIKTWTDPKKDTGPTPTVLTRWRSPGEGQQSINVNSINNGSEYTFHQFSNVKEEQNSIQNKNLAKLDRFHPDVITSKMDVRKTRIGPNDRRKPKKTVDAHGAIVLPMSGSKLEPSEATPTSKTIIHAVDICLQDKNLGRCKGYEPSYYHNKDTKQCELFIYTGCGGNSNLFYTRSDCEKTCNVEPLPVCDQPQDTGTCAGHNPKYFYNKATKTCEQFTYTGCEGNDNRFDTIEQCQATCLYDSLCKLPKDLGPCKYWEPRYWYNPSKKECELFYYGGCDGNKNNFRDIGTCRKHCVSNVR